MTTIAFKRGDTFEINCDVGQSIVGWTIRSQVRDDADNLVLALTVTVTDSATGLYKLSATPAQTALWPANPLLCDIEYTDSSGFVSSTETFTIDCRKDITR